jgi:hypothetical protein
LRPMRNAGKQLPVRQILLLVPDHRQCPHLRGWSDVLRTMPPRLRLQNFRLNGHTPRLDSLECSERPHADKRRSRDTIACQRSGTRAR